MSRNQKQSATAVPTWLAKLAGQPDDRVSVAQTAAALNVHQMTARSWIKNGRVQTVKVGARVFITRESLEKFLGQESAVSA